MTPMIDLSPKFWNVLTTQVDTVLAPPPAGDEWQATGTPAIAQPTRLSMCADLGLAYAQLEAKKVKPITARVAAQGPGCADRIAACCPLLSLPPDASIGTSRCVLQDFLCHGGQLILSTKCPQGLPLDVPCLQT